MKNGFDIALRVTWILFWGSLAGLALLGYQSFFSDNSSGWPFLMFSIPLLVFCVIFLAMLYSLRTAYETGKREIDQGEYFMHWKYSEEEWHSANKREWERTWKRALFIPLGCTGFFYFISILDTEFREQVLPVAGVWIAGFFGILSVLLLFYGYALYRRTFTCPREVFINQHGFSCGGYYTTWNCVGTKLGTVKLIPGDVSFLEFDIQIRGKYGYNSRPVRIAIPRGHEVQAEEVILKLCPP